MPLHITHALGELRELGAAYLEQNHYMRSSGGSGQLFVVLDDGNRVNGAVLIGKTASRNCDRSIAGACLIGPAASADAERRIAQPGAFIRQIKRSHLLDSIPADEMYESHLLRHSMQQVCDSYDRPVLYVSYADPAATDERTGLPLLGWTYLAAGFFYVGETAKRSRSCVIDHHGRARSTRQGAVTIHGSTLPRAGDVFHGEYITRDWKIARLPAARIWLAVTTPSRYTRRQAKVAWRRIWRGLNPERQVAAKIWIDHVAWQRRVDGGIAALGDPKPQHMRALDRFQPAWWAGEDITRTAAPVWVPYYYQRDMLEEHHVAGEVTGRRVYAPLTVQ